MRHYVRPIGRWSRKKSERSKISTFFCSIISSCFLVVHGPRGRCCQLSRTPSPSPEFVAIHFGFVSLSLVSFGFGLFGFDSFGFVLFRFASLRFIPLLIFFVWFRLVSFGFWFRIVSFGLVSVRLVSSCLVLDCVVSFRLVFCFALFPSVSLRSMAAPSSFRLWRALRYRGPAGKARSRPAPLAGFGRRKPRSQAKQGRKPGMFPCIQFEKSVIAKKPLVLSWWCYLGS